MEQSSISIIAPPGITENSVGKSKSIGITLRSNSSIQAAKEKLKAPWLNDLLKEDATPWEITLFCLAEVLGTFILVFLGCMGCVGTLGPLPSIAQISLTFGFAVLIAVQCVGHISGAHINPAITVAALILGKKSPIMTLFYILAQCVGALLGYGLLKAVTPAGFLKANSGASEDSFCMTDVNPELSILQGFVAEVIATAILTFMICGVWDIRNETNSDSVSIRVGLCVAALCFTFIPYTGCSLNPARTLGAAAWNGYWTNHWVFWAGPICGAIFAAIFYRCFFALKTESQDDNLQT